MYRNIYIYIYISIYLYIYIYLLIIREHMLGLSQFLIVSYNKKVTSDLYHIFK